MNLVQDISLQKYSLSYQSERNLYNKTMFSKCIRKLTNGQRSEHFKSYVTKAFSRSSLREKIIEDSYSAVGYTKLSRSNNRRCIATISGNPLTGTTTLTTKEDLEQYFSLYPIVVNDILKEVWDDKVSDALKHFERVLNHNMPNMFSGSGYLVAPIYKYLESPERIIPENIRLANLLGWYAEMLAISICISDDIEDDADSRHHKVCWHKVENVGLTAVNDATLVTQASFLLLKKHFTYHPCYVSIMELLNDAVVKTALGHTLGHAYRIIDGQNLHLCTRENYDTLAKYKLGYFAHLAVRLSMYFTNIHNTQTLNDVKKVLPLASRFWQIDNDVIDCFGDTEVTGKTSSDIAAGEFTWLIVEALQRASGPQKKIIEQNYGKPDPECEKAIRNLYEELRLFDLYVSHKKQCYEIMQNNIESIQNEPLRKLFSKWFQEPVVSGAEVLTSG